MNLLPFWIYIVKHSARIHMPKVKESVSDIWTSAEDLWSDKDLGFLREDSWLYDLNGYVNR